MDPNSNKLILDNNYYNGRVDIMTPPSQDVLFQMKEQISHNNKSTDYENALKGEIEDNILAKVFFSKENIDIIQDGLRAGVYKMSNNKFIIPKQNLNELKVIMRRVYLQHANHNFDKVRSEVEMLNNIILETAVPSVYNNAVSYQKYLLDQSTLIKPLEKPRQVDRDFKQLEVNNFFIDL